MATLMIRPYINLQGSEAFDDCLYLCEDVPGFLHRSWHRDLRLSRTLGLSRAFTLQLCYRFGKFLGFHCLTIRWPQPSSKLYNAAPAVTVRFRGVHDQSMHNGAGQSVP